MYNTVDDFYVNAITAESTPANFFNPGYIQGPLLHEIIVPCTYDGTCGWFLWDQFITKILSHNEYFSAGKLKMNISEENAIYFFHVRNDDRPSFFNTAFYLAKDVNETDFQKLKYILKETFARGKVSETELKFEGESDFNLHFHMKYEPAKQIIKMEMNKHFYRMLHLSSVESKLFRNQVSSQRTVFDREVAASVPGVRDVMLDHFQKNPIKLRKKRLGE